MSGAGWPFAAHDRPSKIVCIGRNYAAHAAELGHAVPEEPLLFLKPPSSLLASGEAIVLPAGIGAVHHEIELGVVIGARLRHASADAAWDGVRGWALGIDLTARDLQAALKKAGKPWTVAKGHDTFCPVSEELPRDAVDPADATLELRVDGTVRQRGTTAAMVWRVPALLAHISSIMTLEPGDLVLTGTPEGVGPLAAGEVVEGYLDGRLLLRHPVVAGA